MKKFLSCSTNALRSPILRQESKDVYDVEMGSLSSEAVPRTPHFILPPPLMNLVLSYLDSEELQEILLTHSGDLLVRYGMPHLNEDTLLFAKEVCFIKPAIKQIDSFIDKKMLLEELRHPIRTKKTMAFFFISNTILFSAGFVFDYILISWALALENEQKRILTKAQGLLDQIFNNCTDIFSVSNGTCTVIPYNDLEFRPDYSDYYGWGWGQNALTCGSQSCSWITPYFNYTSLSDMIDKPKSFNWRDASPYTLSKKHSEYCARSIFKRIPSVAPTLFSSFQNNFDNYSDTRNAGIATSVTGAVVMAALLLMLMFILNRYYNSRKNNLLNTLTASDLPLEGHLEIAWLVHERIGTENKTLGQVLDKLELMQEASSPFINKAQSMISKIGFFNFLNEASNPSWRPFIPSRL